MGTSTGVYLGILALLAHALYSERALRSEIMEPVFANIVILGFLPASSSITIDAR